LEFNGEKNQVFWYPPCENLAENKMNKMEVLLVTAEISAPTNQSIPPDNQWAEHVMFKSAVVCGRG
jgi:hypothetical protein